MLDGLLQGIMWLLLGDMPPLATPRPSKSEHSLAFWQLNNGKRELFKEGENKLGKNTYVEGHIGYQSC